MSGTKILWGQLLVVGAVVLTFLWSATEWVAWRLGFQVQLGHPWFEIHHWSIYGKRCSEALLPLFG
jgi:type IV secretion system protein VirD4